MEETYTCMCGYQQFLINESSIACGSCGKMYNWVVGGDKIETAFDFNKRIRVKKLAKKK